MERVPGGIAGAFLLAILAGAACRPAEPPLQPMEWAAERRAIRLAIVSAEVDANGVCRIHAAGRFEGETVGRVTSGGYGYSVERSIAYAYLPGAAARPGQAVEVEIFGEWVAGEVTEEPLWDPKGKRIRQ